jgi:hypothetical protein
VLGRNLEVRRVGVGIESREEVGKEAEAATPSGRCEKHRRRE